MVLSVRPQGHFPLLEWGGAKPLTSIYIGIGHLENQNVFFMTEVLMAMQKQFDNITVLIQGS